MSTLKEVYDEFRDILETLGIEIGVEVAALWHDRQRHGQPAFLRKRSSS